MSTSLPITITRITTATPDLRALITELDAELSANYPPEQRHAISFDALFLPHMLFFIAHINNQPAGCGGIALFDGFAEVKRMYVRPAHRGHTQRATGNLLPVLSPIARSASEGSCGGGATGSLLPVHSTTLRGAREGACGGVADAIMHRLIDESRRAGRSVIRLETGTHQHAALRFYQRHGFTPCPPFEPYASKPAHTIATSIFMEKTVAR